MKEDEYLMLSGMQHFVFCRRQWALIHIEQQWKENERTIDGKLMHRTAHDENRTEKRGDKIIVRGLRIVSHQLGLSGVCDVVEFNRSETGIHLHGWPDLWDPYPVEYKRGKPKDHDADILQLTAQAMCLEEMMSCTIPEGSLYYGEVRRRQRVGFSDELRMRVTEIASEMHQLYQKGWTPKGKASKKCNACSLKDLCLPKLSRTMDVKEYLKQHLQGENL